MRADLQANACGSALLFFERGVTVDENNTYVNLLKQALAAETETVRLYLALMAVAPESAIKRLLEVNTDETDHQAIVADLLMEATTGQSADQEDMVPGVE